jgi:opacity protein-like surface antigen
MKKIVLTAAVFALTLSTAFSQEFKPKEKEIAVGLGFNDFKTFSLVNGLSARYFYKSDLAIRGGFYIDRESTAQYGYDGTGSETSSSIRNVTKFNLSIGAEKHFSGTDRLDPYVGADILLGMGSDNTDSKFGPLSGSEKRTDTNFGLSLLAGADYYILPKVYVGTEFGITYNSQTIGDVTKTDASGSKTEKNDKPYTQSSINTTIGAAGAIRVGFRF